MSKQDEVAANAVRKSTLKCLKEKKSARIRQIKEDAENAIREVNIQYSEDPERLKAKYAADDFAKSEKARKKAEANIKKEKECLEKDRNLRPFTMGEEIGSAIIQAIGACLFIAGTAVLDTIAIQNAETYESLTLTMYTLFGSSMILMYICSTLSHALTNPGAKEVFNRLSHIFAYLIIGFGYTAYTITKIQGIQGWILFGIVWAVVFTGLLIYAITGSRHPKVNIILCIVAGFSGIFACRSLYNVLSTKSFGMLVAGAAFYLVGLIFYAIRKVKFMHLIGNCIMLAGSIYIFFSLFYINL